VLFGSVVLAATLALATGAAAAWWVVFALLPLAFGYLALVAWARRAAVEREFNLAFLAGASHGPGFEALLAGHGEKAAEPLRRAVRARAGASSVRPWAREGVGAQAG
jgi:hypothetical protein